MSDSSSSFPSPISTASSDYITVHETVQKAVAQQREREDNVPWRLDQGEQFKEIQAVEWHENKIKKKQTNKLDLPNYASNYKKKFHTFGRKNKKAYISNEISQPCDGSSFIASYVSIFKGNETSGVTVEVRSDGSVIAEKIEEKKNYMADETSQKQEMISCVNSCSKNREASFFEAQRIQASSSQRQVEKGFTNHAFSSDTIPYSKYLTHVRSVNLPYDSNFVTRNMRTVPRCVPLKLNDIQCNNLEYPPTREQFSTRSNNINSRFFPSKALLHKNCFNNNKNTLKPSTKQLYRPTQTSLSSKNFSGKHPKDKEYLKSNKLYISQNISLSRNNNGDLHTQRRGTNGNYIANEKAATPPDQRILCPNIVLYGYCSYGFECQFSHNTQQVEKGELLYNSNCFEDKSKKLSSFTNVIHRSEKLAMSQNIKNISSLISPNNFSDTQNLALESSGEILVIKRSYDQPNPNYFEAYETRSEVENKITKQDVVPSRLQSNFSASCMNHESLESLQVPPPPYTKITSSLHSQAIKYSMKFCENSPNLFSNSVISRNQPFIVESSSTIISPSINIQETEKTIKNEKLIKPKNTTQHDLIDNLKAAHIYSDTAANKDSELIASDGSFISKNLKDTVPRYSIHANNLIELKNNLTYNISDNNSFASSLSLISEKFTNLSCSSFFSSLNTTATPFASPTVTYFDSSSSAYSETSTSTVNSSFRQLLLNISCFCSSASSLSNSSSNIILKHDSTFSSPNSTMSAQSVSEPVENTAVLATSSASSTSLKTVENDFSFPLSPLTALPFPQPSSTSLSLASPESSLFEMQSASISSSSIHTSALPTVCLSLPVTTCNSLYKVIQYSPIKAVCSSSCQSNCLAVESINHYHSKITFSCPSETMLSSRKIIDCGFTHRASPGSFSMIHSSKSKSICDSPSLAPCSSLKILQPQESLASDLFSAGSACALPSFSAFLDSFVSNVCCTSIFSSSSFVAPFTSSFLNHSFYASSFESPIFTSFIPSIFTPTFVPSSSVAYLVSPTTAAPFVSSCSTISILPTFDLYPMAFGSVATKLSTVEGFKSFIPDATSKLHVASEAPEFDSGQIPTFSSHYNATPVISTSSPNFTHTVSSNFSQDFENTSKSLSKTYTKVAFDEWDSNTPISTPIASEKPSMMIPSSFCFSPASGSCTPSREESTTDRNSGTYYNHPALSDYSSFFSSVLTLSSIQRSDSPEKYTKSVASNQSESSEAGLMLNNIIPCVSDHSFTSCNNSKPNAISTFLNSFSVVQNDPVAAEKLISKVCVSSPGSAVLKLPVNSWSLPSSSA